jgi:SAM-dependent MidA family methyltransferase
MANFNSRQGRDPVEVKVPKRERAEKKARANKVERRAAQAEMVGKFKVLRAAKRQEKRREKRERAAGQGNAA